jgi:hypothetical protein
MPTDRHRYMITMTDEVQSALAVAARHWPGETPTQLLYHLIHEGQRALRGDVEHRRRVIAANAGALSGAYEPGYLESLRQEWPE